MPHAKQGHKSTIQFKRRLRANTTEPERRLWSRLRSRQLGSLKFRRQHGVGPYVVDFYCPERSIVIEIDGDTHADGDTLTRDERREHYLKALDLHVIRYTNREIMTDLDGVMLDLFTKLSD